MKLPGLFNVYDNRGKFLMTASIETISHVFGLQRPAVERILSETSPTVDETDPASGIFFNGRGPQWIDRSIRSILVRRAIP